MEYLWTQIDKGIWLLMVIRWPETCPKHTNIEHYMLWCRCRAPPENYVSNWIHSELPTCGFSEDVPLQAHHLYAAQFAVGIRCEIKTATNMHPLPNVAPIKFDFSKLSLLHGCIRSVWHKNCDNCDHSVAASKLTITEVEKNSEDKIGSHRNFTHLSWTLKAHDFRIFKFQQEIYLPAICGWLPSWLSGFIRKTKSTKLPAWGTKLNRHDAVQNWLWNIFVRCGSRWKLTCMQGIIHDRYNRENSTVLMRFTTRISLMYDDYNVIAIISSCFLT